MAYEQRDNNGSLFKNDKKQQTNQRDYNGSCMIGGQEYWISAWLKKSQSGVPYMSLAFELKQQPQQSYQQPQQQAPYQTQQAPRQPQYQQPYQEIDPDMPF